MKIELKKMVLDNYKKFKADDGVKEFDFFHRTQITGRNKEGKSTLVNAYLDILTGKELDGSQPESVRPHDENGKDCNDAEVIREITLLIDGKEKKIRKITKKNFNSRKKVYTGNSTEYEIDDFGANATKFKEFISEIADPDVLLMCSNANPFLTTLRKSTADARKILEKMAGFNLQDFIASNQKYAVIADLTKGHSVEDAFKKLRKDLTAQKKKVEAQNERIKHEQSRPLASSNIEVSDLELAKGEWKDKLAEVDEQEQALEQSVKAYDELSEEIRKMKLEKASLGTDALNKLMRKKMAVREKLSEAENKERSLEIDLGYARVSEETASASIQRYEDDIQRYRQQYMEISEQEFDETHLHEIEAEQFDENSYICPTCGQELPAERKEKLLADFEERKKSRIAMEEQKRKNFLIEQDSQLNELTRKGNKAAEDLKAAKQNKAEYEQKISEITANIEAIQKEIEKLKAELSAIPDEPDYSQIEDYDVLCETIKGKEAFLANLDSGSEKRLELRQKRNQYMTEIANIDSQIQTAAREQENKENILNALQVELWQMAQVQANIEKQIDILSEFSRAKNEALAKKINPHMEGFEFRFLAYTIEKNPYETLEIWRDGVEFKDLNYSDRLIVQANMLRGFQRINNLDLPIWIDNIESVNSDRIPNLDTQMIVLRVSDGDLAICEC